MITYQFTGLAAGADVLGLPAEGLVFIEPAEESRAAFYAADVRYSGHIQNRLALKASSNPGTIKVIVGWIG